MSTRPLPTEPERRNPSLDGRRWRTSAAAALAVTLAALFSGCGGSEGTADSEAAGHDKTALAAAQSDTPGAMAAAMLAPTAAQRWSDPATWGGSLPRAGSRVVIPVGKNVVLDTATPALAGLVIEGSLQADPARDVAITAGHILVRGGRLSVGTADRPYLRQARITLTGASTADVAPGFGNKVLGQIGGTIEMHGQPIARSWTRLDGADVAAGARRITLAEAPGWRVGDRIVIATSSFEQGEYDVAQIAAINGRSVDLTAPLRYRHFGAVRKVGNRDVDVRAEVGLLSRNILVQGDAPSASLAIGGHAMFMAGSQGATVQLAGVEFARMGQLNQLGRYPLHFHLMGQACRQCYLRDNSVHSSVQRGIVVHGTSGVTLAGNVVFNTVGHNIVLEDSATTGNVLERNLALVNRQPHPLHTEPTLVSQEDRMPSNYWIRAGANSLVGNHAAGSWFNGFNFVGIDASEDGRPGAALMFRGNVAHAAMGRPGEGEGDFDISGGLLISSEAPRPANEVIADVLVYHSAFGYWLEENGVTTVERFVAAENGVNLFGRGVGNRMHFKDGLVIGRLAGGVLGKDTPALHYTYGSDTLLENLTFAGYRNLNFSAGETVATQSSVSMRGISFIGARPALDFGDTLRYLAEDDTLLPRGYYVSKLNPWLAVTAECSIAIINPADADVYSYYRCPRSYGLSELDVRSGGSGTGASRINPWLLRSDGLRYRRGSGGDSAAATGVHGTTVLHDTALAYHVEHNAGAAPVHLRLADEGLRFTSAAALADPKRALVSLPMAAPPRAVHRTGTSFDRPEPPSASSALTPAASLAELQANPMSRYFHDSTNRRLWMHAGTRWASVYP
ncbi:MAG: hypothetical protein JNJ71_19905 [Rubrivivax sp.]|nr:hypothetical protein [Rubrivivax sp.]